MNLGEVLWAPQIEGELVTSDLDEQDSGELCEGVTEGEPVKYNLGRARLLITVLKLHSLQPMETLETIHFY